METNTVATVITAVVSLLLGGGGIVGILTWWSQRRAGIRQDDRADDEFLNKKTQELLQAQLDLLVKPLQEELSRVRDMLTQTRVELTETNTKVAAAEKSIRETQNRYWYALSYIRELLHWSRTHVPEGTTPPPEIPGSLSHDL